MGKRASDLADTNEEILQDIQLEENPAFIFTGPRSSYKPKPPQRLTQQQYDNISRIIRQWILNYRRPQETPNDTICDCEQNVQIIDMRNLPNILDYDEINDFDMTSLGTLMLLEQNATRINPKSCDTLDEDSHLQRLSLAYEKLCTIPKILLEEFTPYVKILDISSNEFENLEFLAEFKELTHLICDHNKITSRTNIPYLPKLELLWLNHCRITELYPWARKLQRSCPNLKYLSLMGNPVAPSYLNGGNFYEYLHYRLFMISLFPNLVHLDDNEVTPNQRLEAQRTYQKPLVKRIVARTHQNLPAYLRVMSEKVSEIIAFSPDSAVSQKNFII
ncbi:hypothetical protein NQ317_016422 [Molorchus minor]|uniref:Leucine-rich melanocyte differentiation-associated protein-like n=1 Tax=Molorchus minor TaxID=1323400 RepID=A0ABQ9JZB0_9CUCU|nr:hypothetical protein NQ317_016422 [Molorchus minor]